MSHKASPWIYSPALDLTIGCGAWSLPLLLLAYPFSGANQPVWTVSFYALALVFNYPHYMATIYRAYHTRDDFNRYRIFTLQLTVLLALTLIVAHWSYRLVPWLFTIYITWSPWHYMGQNFGLAMMFIRRNGIHIDRKDRDALWTAFVASYAMIFLSFHTNPSADPYVISLGLPSVLDVLRIPLLAIFAILGLWPLGKLIRKFGWRSMLGPVTLYVTEFLWFALPTVLELTTGFRVPQTRYSAGVLALMHSAQYIWITSYYARQEAQAARNVSWRWGSYFVTLVIGGIALFVPGPWFTSYVLGQDFGWSFLVFTALVNIHHFILDGAVWKLREKRIASLLIRPEADTEADTAGDVTIASPGDTAHGWRFAKVGVALALLLLAGLDQVRYYLGVRQNSSSSLILAASLNPHDASIQTRLGQAYASSGQVDQMERALRESIRINPYNVDSQNLLARLLIERKRFDDAYTHYQQMFAHINPDAAGLTNFGVLCNQRNDSKEAMESFERALQLDAGYPPAHLYLAETLQASGKGREAIPHYEDYIALLSSSSSQVIMDPRLVLGASTKLAGAYAEAGQLDKALATYKNCLKMAEEATDRKLQSSVLIRIAQLYEDMNQTGEARQSYQNALRLDAESSDDGATGADWFAYGSFLERSGVSRRTAYACYLKAELLAGDSAGDSEGSAAISAARKRMEIELGRDASSVKAGLNAVLDEAMSDGT